MIGFDMEQIQVSLALISAGFNATPSDLSSILNKEFQSIKNNWTSMNPQDLAGRDEDMQTVQNALNGIRENLQSLYSALNNQATIFEHMYYKKGSNN